MAGQEQGIDVELITIGNKGTTYFKRRETPIRKDVACTQAPTAAQAQEIADELLASYYAGELDRIELLLPELIELSLFLFASHLREPIELFLPLALLGFHVRLFMGDVIWMDALLIFVNDLNGIVCFWFILFNL